jgi:AcrR family transcriptional regulator
LTSSITVAGTNSDRNKRSPGRTRSEAARVAILNATLSLLETQSLQQITIEAIAKEAGVGKATIYRWWPSKAAVVIDAFLQNHIMQTHMPRGGSCREAITVHLHRMVQQYDGGGGRLVAQILAEGQSDPEVLREFRERFFYGRRAMVREVIEEGRRNGEFRTDMDSEFLMDIVYSPVYFRLIMGHLPLSQQFADELAESAMVVLCNPVPAQR